MGRTWHVAKIFTEESDHELLRELMMLRGIDTPDLQKDFLHPQNPGTLIPSDVGIDESSLETAVSRIKRAIGQKESVVVYADYDADGVTAGAVLWEALWKLGARVMPYIPHRVEEGYGLSEKGIDAVRDQFDPALIITVDHGISAARQVEYAKKLGMEVIVTDHHTKPETVPDTTVVHTTRLSGSGVSWFLAKEVMKAFRREDAELIVFPAIGTIADLLPLTGANRMIVKYGLSAMASSKRPGLRALMEESGTDPSSLTTYSVSHVLAPRLNAMGRLDHALDALRLLCTKDMAKATFLAEKLGATNRERQQLTADMYAHARGTIGTETEKLIFISHESYNPGVIGLVAGRLTEEFYRPSIVLARGEEVAKASARSIPGFNIIEAIRMFDDLLVDAGGHPMAAGFTVKLSHIDELRERLVALANETLTDDLLVRVLPIDGELPANRITESLFGELNHLEPYGFGNPEPVFATRGLIVLETRLVGKEGKHVKLRLRAKGQPKPLEAIAFNFGAMAPELVLGTAVDVAYALDVNEWKGKRTLQLRIKDLVIPKT